MEFVVAFLVGVSVFVVGQLLLKMVIEPIRDFLLVLSEIDHELHIRDRSNANYKYLELYFGSLENKSNRLREFRSDLPIEDYYAFRSLAGSLLSKYKMIPFYRCLSFLGKRLPPKEDVFDANILILDLASRSITNQDDPWNNKEIINKIRAKLNI